MYCQGTGKLDWIENIFGKKTGADLSKLVVGVNINPVKPIEIVNVDFEIKK